MNAKALILNDFSYSNKTKINVYKTFIRSKFEYSLSIMKLKKGLIKKLNNLQH